MSVNLLNLFRERIEEQLIDHANPPSGLSVEKIRTFLDFLVPTLFTAAVRKGSSEEGAGQLHEFLANFKFDTTAYDNTSDQSASDGNGSVHFLLGKTTPELAELFCSHTGIDQEDVHMLISPVSGYFMSEFNRYVREKSIDELGLFNLLRAQRKESFENLPDRIRTFPLIEAARAGMESKVDENRGPAHENARGKDFGSVHEENPELSIPPGDEDSTQFGKILPWIILALASLALLWFLNKKEEVPPVQNPGSGAPTDTLTERTNIPDQVDDMIVPMEGSGDSSAVLIQLPDSSTMATTGNSFEKKLFDLITGQETDSINSIILEHVEFETGTAEMVAGSDRQLAKLARLLNAFPSVKIRVVAHTENDGNSSENLELSNRRADAIQNWLIENGIKASRVDIFGMGHEEPLVSNETEAGRSKNRRIEIFLVGK